eukprot:14229108-Alexandrium_andersonii.AAC.1
MKRGSGWFCDGGISASLGFAPVVFGWALSLTDRSASRGGRGSLASAAHERALMLGCRGLVFGLLGAGAEGWQLRGGTQSFAFVVLLRAGVVLVVAGVGRALWRHLAGLCWVELSCDPLATDAAASESPRSLQHGATACHEPVTVWMWSGGAIGGWPGSAWN